MLKRVVNKIPLQIRNPQFLSYRFNFIYPREPHSLSGKYNERNDRRVRMGYIAGCSGFSPIYYLLKYFCKMMRLRGRFDDNMAGKRALRGESLRVSWPVSLVESSAAIVHMIKNTGSRAGKARLIATKLNSTQLNCQLSVRRRRVVTQLK